MNAERVPGGSVEVRCPNCYYAKADNWDLYEAVTDAESHPARYYAVCHYCGQVMPLKPKKVK